MTESSDATYSPGDPLQLTLDYDSNFVNCSYVGCAPGDLDVQAKLVMGNPVVDLAGFWTWAEFRLIDIRTGDEVPCCPPPDAPFIATQLDVALEAGVAPELLRFDGVLWWPPQTTPGELDGTEFLEHFEGGEVELIRDGATVLRGQLVPEPSTGLLLAGGLLALGMRHRRTIQ